MNVVFVVKVVDVVGGVGVGVAVGGGDRVELVLYII